MARLVKKTAKGPLKVGDKNICMCGLSENQPFCDSSHKKTLKEDDDKLYWYGNGKAEEIAVESQECSCEACQQDHCGNDCCCGDQCQH